MINLKLVNPKHTAILVIDIQNDYCSKNGKIATVRKIDVSPVQDIVSPLVNLIKVARSKNVPIIFTRMIEDHRYMKENAKIKFQASLKPLDLCSPDSKGFEYYKVRPEKNDFEIIKKSYDAFSNPELSKILKKIKVKNLIITGAYTAVCVDATLRAAYTKGYNIIVPQDLVSMPKERLYMHNAALDVWNLIFAHIVNSKEIVSVWNKK
jgi:ureidoacrylate peracid hydrolase